MLSTAGVVAAMQVAQHASDCACRYCHQVDGDTIIQEALTMEIMLFSVMFLVKVVPDLITDLWSKHFHKQA